MEKKEILKNDKEEKSFVKNSYFLTFVTTGIVVLSILLIVFFAKYFLPEKYFNASEKFISENEIILVVALGLVGIYYAIRAMMEAKASLKQSQEIYEAISSFFSSYDEISGRLEKLIDNANDKLLIVVSLPAFGLIVNEPLGKKFFSALSKKITKCKTDNFKIEFICFSQNKCKPFEETFKTQFPNVFITYLDFKKQILTEMDSVRKLKRNLGDSSYENLWMLQTDTNIRLFIADDEKAIFATVPDFDANNPKDTSIAGFETTEKKMIEILKLLFDRQKINSGTRISDSDFKEYFN